MSNMEYNPELDGEQAWVSRFIELQLKELDGMALTLEEERFLAGVELAMRLVPGALEQAVLEYGLSEDAPAADEELYELRIAAHSSESKIYEEVNRALQNEEAHVRYQVDEGDLAVLRIDKADMVVEPIYQEGYTFVIERKGGGKQLVGKYGGIFIAIEDLKNMMFSYDPANKVITIYEK